MIRQPITDTVRVALPKSTELLVPFVVRTTSFALRYLAFLLVKDSSSGFNLSETVFLTLAKQTEITSDLFADLRLRSTNLIHQFDFSKLPLINLYLFLRFKVFAAPIKELLKFVRVQLIIHFCQSSLG